MEKLALRPESKASRRRHMRRPPCTRSAASARQVMLGSSRLSLPAKLRDLDKLLHNKKAASLNVAALGLGISRFFQALSANYPKSAIAIDRNAESFVVTVQFLSLVVIEYNCRCGRLFD